MEKDSVFTLSFFVISTLGETGGSAEPNLYKTVGKLAIKVISNYCVISSEAEETYGAFKINLLMKYGLVIFINLLIFTGCNYSRNPETDFMEILDDQEKCFLDFRLGMRDYKYEKLVKEYISDGILQETLIPREYNADLRILNYNFESIRLTGELEALILFDRLLRLSILVKEEKNEENNKTITINKYKKLVKHFKSKYGKPTEIKINAESIHRSTIWEQENYILSISVYPSIDDSENIINISFDPTEYLQKAFDVYREEKKIEEGKLQ